MLPGGRQRAVVTDAGRGPLWAQARCHRTRTQRRHAIRYPQANYWGPQASATSLLCEENSLPFWRELSFQGSGQCLY